MPPTDPAAYHRGIIWHPKVREAAATTMTIDDDEGKKQQQNHNQQRQQNQQPAPPPLLPDDIPSMTRPDSSAAASPPKDSSYCAACTNPDLPILLLPSSSFSRAQWKKPVDGRRCRDCASAGIEIGEGGGRPVEGRGEQQLEHQQDQEEQDNAEVEAEEEEEEPSSSEPIPTPKAAAGVVSPPSAAPEEPAGAATATATVDADAGATAKAKADAVGSDSSDGAAVDPEDDRVHVGGATPPGSGTAATGGAEEEGTHHRHRRRRPKDASETSRPPPADGTRDGAGAIEEGGEGVASSAVSAEAAARNEGSEVPPVNNNAGEEEEDGRADNDNDDTRTRDGGGVDPSPAAGGAPPVLTVAESDDSNGDADDDDDGDDDDADAELEFDLSFADYVDVQTRLVLVPLDDGACTGAVVASYEPPSPPPPVRGGEEDGGGGGGGDFDEAEEGMEDVELGGGGAGSEADEEEEEEEEKKTDAMTPASTSTPGSKRPPLPCDAAISDAAATEGAGTAPPPPPPPDAAVVVGSILIGIPNPTGDNGEEDDDDWTGVDFAHILGAVRKCASPLPTEDHPIVLRFRRRSSSSSSSPPPPPSSKRAETSAVPASASSSTEPITVEVGGGGSDDCSAVAEEGASSSSPSSSSSSSEAKSALSSRLSRWGSKASSLATEAKGRAKVAMEEAEKLVAEQRAQRAAAAAAALVASPSSREEADGDDAVDSRGGSAAAAGDAARDGAMQAAAAAAVTQPENGGRPPLVPILSPHVKGSEASADAGAGADAAAETAGPPLPDGTSEEEGGRGTREGVPPPPPSLPPPDENAESGVAGATEGEERPSAPSKTDGVDGLTPPLPPLVVRSHLPESLAQLPKPARPPTWDEAGLDCPPCGLFLQMASGGFVHLEVDSEGFGADSLVSSLFGPSVVESALSPLPMRRTVSSNSIASAGSPSRKGGIVSSSSSVASRKKLARLHPVSNTSVLLIRASADRPCPARGYSYQWYRSAGFDDDDRRHSGTSSEGTDSFSDCSMDGVSDADHCAPALGWYALPGATYAAFQPSATDVGHRVRCVVTVEQKGDVPSDGSTKDTFTVNCELPYPIVADSGLFEAARQTFGKKGRMFSNFKGRGNAEGRSFRLQLAPSESGSRMRILQVSGNTAEPIHDIQEPILNASAVSAAAEPKVFDIVFPSGLPPSGMMVNALCTEDGRFQLKAPNRVTRESLLLALGIANHCGKSRLHAGTVLFPRSPLGVVIEMDGVVAPDTFLEGNDVPKVVSGKSEDKGCASRDEETRPIPDEETKPVTKPVLSIPIPPLSSPKSPGADANIAASDEQFQALEDELRTMLEKLFAKEKAVSDLQRRIAQSESARTRSEDTLTSLRSGSNATKAQYKECKRSLRNAEKKIEMHESAMSRMNREYELRVSSLEERVKEDEKKNAEYEKTIKALQNEKAVLSAAVEARDGKLSKMEQMQLNVQSLQSEVAKGHAVQKQLVEMTAKFNATRAELGHAKSSEKQGGEEVKRLKKSQEEMLNRVEAEKKLATKCKFQMENTNAKCQQLKAERNSYKQKADSLSKEMSRVCKNGMGVDEIEKVIQDHETLKMEVSLLQTQKRKALDELEESRRLHERSLQAQERAGVDEEVIRALEQRSELERVVSDLTEYINAKEMQLETMMEVNKTLQTELHLLAQSKMGNDEV